ncbi:hypothetical protein EP7_003727 [Isosphaeraceae bacterium EP7]
MNGPRKLVLVILGFISALLILSQLVMGQLIVGGNVKLIKSHQHTGYLAVVVALLYIGASLPAILSIPTRRDR